MNIRFSGQYSMARVTAKQFNYINSHKGMQSNLLQGGSRKNLLNYLVNVSGERLTFYNQNRSSSNTLLDAINFFDEAVSADTSFNGYFYFGSDGGGAGHRRRPRAGGGPKPLPDGGGAAHPAAKDRGHGVCLPKNRHFPGGRADALRREHQRPAPGRSGGAPGTADLDAPAAHL